MSSSGLLEHVTPQWLQERMGATRRWGADALSVLLDGPFLQRLRTVWNALPGGSQAVIKHRLLLSLLTLKTPLSEEALNGARALVATALLDKSPDAQVRPLPTTH